MQVGDLVRFKQDIIPGYSLRLIRSVDGDHIGTWRPNRIKRQYYKDHCNKRVYTPTTMTIDDCRWLKKNKFKVALRTTDKIEMVRLCVLSGQKETAGVWKTIVLNLKGKEFIPQISGTYVEAGRISTSGLCPFVVPTCCLTLAVPIVIKKTASVGTTEDWVTAQFESARDQMEPTPEGWDNCSRGYCKGDWLIWAESGGNRGMIYGFTHPRIKLVNSFTSAKEAADYIEVTFK